jgi:hypothetical protein
MGFQNLSALMAGVGFSAGQALALQDQECGLGNLATPPSQGGVSTNPNGNIFTFFGSAGNGADVTEDTLKSFNLPANALDAVGRTIYIYAWGSYANNANTKAAKLYFGTTSIAAATGQNVGWALEMVVGKSAANTQQISAQNITGTAHGGVSNTAGATNTDTSAITIKVTGQDTTSSNANAIVLNGLMITYSN